MITNLNQMKTDIQAEFETLIDFVTGEEARTATADHIERGLFTRLLSLGAQLLLLFFQMRSQASSRDTLILEDGQELPHHDEAKRTYFSIFGRIPLWRPYFYKKGLNGQTPLDAQLSLGSDSYSDFLRDLVEYMAVYVPSYGKAMKILARVLEFNVSTRAVQKMAGEDAQDIEAYYEQKPAPKTKDEAEILVIQADGKGIPMVLEEPAEHVARLGKGQKRGRKKEAVVTTVYTISTKTRTPQDVVDSLFYPKKPLVEPESAPAPPPKPQNKHIWATLDGKDAALARLAKQTVVRHGDHIQHKVALTDGDPALQKRIENQFPDFELILDFIHPNEYLWDAANALFDEKDEDRIDWMAEQTLAMLSNQTGQIIVDFRTLAQAPQTTKRQHEKLAIAANYFERNLHRMDYQTYLAKGWPIASGVIEGACRHFVKDRFELSGMRWTQNGAEHLLHLRSIAENGDWDAYQLYRQQKRHARLYTTTYPGISLETQVLECDPSLAFQQANSPHLNQSTSLAEAPVSLNTSTNYYALPLAV